MLAVEQRSYPMAKGFISRRYRAAMVSAIDDAAKCSIFRSGSMTDGLRAIRLFEEINGLSFDPFNSHHRSITSGMGAQAGFFRRLRLRGLLRDPHHDQ